TADLAIPSAVADVLRPDEVVVPTERPHWYGGFGDRILVRRLTPEELVAWSGPQKFVWRIVLKSLAEAAARGEAHFLYLDTDTLVRKPLADLIDALQKGDVFLHALASPLPARRPGR